MASKLGPTPSIRFILDKEGQLYVYDSITKDKQLIPMRANKDGTKTSRALASEIESASWDFRWEHKFPSKPTTESTPPPTEPPDKEA